MQETMQRSLSGLRTITNYSKELVMITITELELVLFIAFGVMTAMWFKLRAELYMHKRITTELMTRIASGKMKVVETDDGFDFQPQEKS